MAGHRLRIGVVYEWKPNAHYRVLVPLGALQRRGHEVVLATQAGATEFESRFDPRRLRGCDVVYGYRGLARGELRHVEAAVARGAAFVWDTDDDLSALPRESPFYKESGGAAAQRIFAETVRCARLADVVTTSSALLAQRYATAAGAARVEVLENALDIDAGRLPRRPRGRRDGVVVGWAAGLEHRSELPRIPIEDALRRLLDAHTELRVETFGVRLDLSGERYAHQLMVPFGQLRERLAAWDLAIAPLADIPFNRARSDVKLKEYASANVPWLASPIGPYVGLGERQGGLLVPDDGWFDALDRLIRGRLARRRLARRARAWARTQTIEPIADRWEAVFREAVQRRAAR